MSVVDTILILQSKDLDVSSEDFLKSALLGWMVELLQASFLVSDDMADVSESRRGAPCWYQVPGVGLTAINDAFMLKDSIYLLLRRHFRARKNYIELLELFQEVTFQTECGQLCDLLTVPGGVDLSNFNMDKFNFIITYKTAYYSFYLPVALAMHYLDLATPKNLRIAHDILIPMGKYFQVQDDYLDAFGDPEILGKVGTDIQNNKCSWLVNQALQRVNHEQRVILEENYGRKYIDNEIKVKSLYHELKLPELYRQWEESCLRVLIAKIEAVDETEGLKKEVFMVFLDKIRERSR
jgi:farnesyl diphosphate synthase